MAFDQTWLGRWWAGASADDKQRLGKQIVEGFCEAGVLLVALGPLEAATHSDYNLIQAVWKSAPIVGIGFLAFVIGVSLQWRFIKHDKRGPTG